MSTTMVGVDDWITSCVAQNAFESTITFGNQYVDEGIEISDRGGDV
jgi:hypothetical protein